MVSLDALIILTGIVYGYVHPGKEDKMKILKNGLRWGLIIGVIIGIIGLMAGGIIAGLAAGAIGIPAFIIIALRVSIVFIIGTFVGDFLEGVLKK